MFTKVLLLLNSESQKCLKLLKCPIFARTTKPQLSPQSKYRMRFKFSPVQSSGSHKRSHSLGEKEIGRLPASLPPEQPFRDRSSTLSEKPTLPIIRDKYKDLTGEVEVNLRLIITTTKYHIFWKDFEIHHSVISQESERYAYEWQRCLESALEVCTDSTPISNFIYNRVRLCGKITPYRLLNGV